MRCDKSKTPDTVKQHTSSPILSLERMTAGKEKHKWRQKCKNQIIDEGKYEFLSKGDRMSKRAVNLVHRNTDRDRNKRPHGNTCEANTPEAFLKDCKVPAVGIPDGGSHASSRPSNQFSAAVRANLAQPGRAYSAEGAFVRADVPFTIWRKRPPVFLTAIFHFKMRHECVSVLAGISGRPWCEYDALVL